MWPCSAETSSAIPWLSRLSRCQQLSQNAALGLDSRVPADLPAAGSQSESASGTIPRGGHARSAGKERLARLPAPRPHPIGPIACAATSSNRNSRSYPRVQNALLLKWHQPQCTRDVDESVTIWGPYPYPPKKPSLTIGARACACVHAQHLRLTSRRETIGDQVASVLQGSSRIGRAHTTRCCTAWHSRPAKITS
jgi:hypothetical protein